MEAPGCPLLFLLLDQLSEHGTEIGETATYTYGGHRHIDPHQDMGKKIWLQSFLF